MASSTDSETGGQRGRGSLSCTDATFPLADSYFPFSEKDILPFWALVSENRQEAIFGISVDIETPRDDE